MITRSDSYYDIELGPLNSEGCTVSIIRNPAEKDIIHTPEEYDFPDSLYQDHWEKAEAYGVVSDVGQSTAPVRTIAAVTHADMPCRSVAFSSPLELFPQPPIGSHYGIKHLVGHRRPGRITGKIIGLLSTGICFV